VLLLGQVSITFIDFKSFLQAQHLCPPKTTWLST
jgi:hypothetical protein